MNLQQTMINGQLLLYPILNYVHNYILNIYCYMRKRSKFFPQDDHQCLWFNQCLCIQCLNILPKEE